MTPIEIFERDKGSERCIHEKTMDRNYEEFYTIPTFTDQNPVRYCGLCGHKCKVTMDYVMAFSDFYGFPKELKERYQR